MSVELITMERFAHRENVQLGFIPQRSFITSNPSSKNPLTSSDVDFHDVFGGPPRRLSMNEVRCSFSETTGSNVLREEEETLSYSRRWSGLIERPVFGEESVNRRLLPSQDFFDDIFRGDESVSSTPRRSEHRDPFSLTPGSRVLSPARPLPPRAEFLGSPSSLPPQFSLSSKLVKGTDFPAMASVTSSPSRKKDGAQNGISSPYSPSTSMSRFSNPAIQGQDEFRNNVWPSYRQSPLSHKFSLSSEESAKGTKSDKTNAGGNLKKDLNSSDVPTNNGQFHFSIYKWASKGVPLMMPLRGGSSSRLKEKNNIKRSWSCNGKVEDESIIIESTTATLSGTECPSLNNSASANAVSYSCGMECKKQDNKPLLNTSTQEKLEPCQTDEEVVLAKRESVPLNSLQTTDEDIPGNTILCHTREETNPHSLRDIGLCGKTEEEISVLTKEACEPELKPLHALFSDNNDELGKDEKRREVGRKESMVKTTKKSTGNVNVDKSVKQRDGKRTILSGVELDKASFQGSPVNTRDSPGRNKIKGRVKEFVKIFNQEAPSKPIINVETRSQCSRWKGAGSFKAEKVESVNTNRTDENMDMPAVDKKMTSTNVSVKADECFKPLEKQHSGIDTTIHIFSDSSSGRKDSPLSSSASTLDGSETTIGNIDDSFQGNFLDFEQLKELSEEQNKLSQTGEDHDDFQVSDAKIRKWSNGKESNIRSLLSTLQYVLWPESGWKPVPLVNIIEGNAVKKAYQKALLCLHPDKLQQKGAAAHQKYIAEKVFDILQEAWIHFNSLGSL